MSLPPDRSKEGSLPLGGKAQRQGCTNEPFHGSPNPNL
jgi:hypothetical protein